MLYLKRSVVFTVVSMFLAHCKTPDGARNLNGTHGAEGGYEFTVCGATVNSPDEFEIFKEELSKEGGFRFEELTDNAPYASSAQREEWFSASCRDKKIQCDVLIVSGHFGGHFFGDSQKYDLYLNTLETASCQNSCGNIIHRPLETFLFGCNTLAGKADDGRNRQEYRNLLINEDHIPPDQADRIIAARYGPWGGTWGDRMLRGFKNVENVYGYTSRSPLGRKNRKKVRAYIQRIKKENGGSYKNYLRKLQERRSSRGDDTRVVPNNTFFTTFKGQAILQEIGSSSQDRFYQDTCKLKDQKTPVSERLGLVSDILGKSQDPDDKGRLKYFLVISEFVQKSISMHDLASLKPYLDSSSNLPAAKSQYLDGLAKTESPPILIDLAVLGYTLGWISKNEAYDTIHRALNGFDDKSHKRDYSTYLACVAGNSYKDLGKFFTYNDIAHADDLFKVEMIGCMRMQDRASKNYFLDRYIDPKNTRDFNFDMRIKMFIMQEYLIPNKDQIRGLIAKYRSHESEQSNGCYYELGQSMTILDNLDEIPKELNDFYEELLADDSRNQCDQIIKLHKNAVASKSKR